RYGLDFVRQVGPRVAPLWRQPLDLGAPLHESQSNDMGTVLFVATQEPANQACLVTAVEADTGRIHWQRQLGLICQDQPCLVGDSVLAVGEGGGLYRFDISKHLAAARHPWLSGSASVAPALNRGPIRPLYLVSGNDGRSAYEFACSDGGKRL